MTGPLIRAGFVLGFLHSSCSDAGMFANSKDDLQEASREYACCVANVQERAFDECKDYKKKDTNDAVVLIDGENMVFTNVPFSVSNEDLLKKIRKNYPEKKIELLRYEWPDDKIRSSRYYKCINKFENSSCHTNEMARELAAQICLKDGYSAGECDAAALAGSLEADAECSSP